MGSGRIYGEGKDYGWFILWIEVRVRVAVICEFVRVRVGVRVKVRA